MLVFWCTLVLQGVILFCERSFVCAFCYKLLVLFKLMPPTASVVESPLAIERYDYTRCTLLTR